MGKSGENNKLAYSEKFIEAVKWKYVSKMGNLRRRYSFGKTRVNITQTKTRQDILRVVRGGVGRTGLYL